MSEPTFDTTTDQRVVYDPEKNWDDSGYLRVKYLYLHFPRQLKILSIMIFERKKMVTEKWYHNLLTRTKPSEVIHHAIVYTEG